MLFNDNLVRCLANTIPGNNTLKCISYVSVCIMLLHVKLQDKRDNMMFITATIIFIVN